MSRLMPVCEEEILGIWASYAMVGRIGPPRDENVALRGKTETQEGKAVESKDLSPARCVGWIASARGGIPQQPPPEEQYLFYGHFPSSSLN
ncbi:unnamed protein product [Larinioides sclopetarius]|uniref:Uncharacterized protein n=1 Tax=Larinioides sclopetarius TaxID=280406 RepID=A0AAV2ALE1_9ARAC